MWTLPANHYSHKKYDLIRNENGNNFKNEQGYVKYDEKFV